VNVPSLTVSQLFTPASSGVSQTGAVPLTPASGTWLSLELQAAAIVQLPTTSWQPGAPERTILAINAVMLSQSDAFVSAFAQGAFLYSAATGTVTYQALNGQQITTPVTPDPSNPAQNPTGALGWLDLLGQNVYDVDRLAATFAAGPLAIANLGVSTAGPYVAGTFHAANTSSGATYSNTLSFSVPPSTIAGSGGVVTGVTVGLTTTVITTQSPHGLTAGASVYINVPTTSGVSGLAGVFALVTAAVGNVFSVSLGSSGTYTSGGNVYLCTVASMQADAVSVGSNAAIGAVTTAVTQIPAAQISNLVPWSASNWESNLAYAGRCQASLAAASPNGPSQAYIYFALSAQQILSKASPPYTFTNGGITAANNYSNPQTGLIYTVVASATPASSTLGAAVTPGVAQLPITAVTNANPCVITCASNTSLAPGQSMTVAISGVLGTAGVNGSFLGTYVSATSFSIPIDTSAAGSYTGGGFVEGGDLGAVDALLQENVVPDNETALTVSALALPVTVVATVSVPQAYVQTYKLAAPAAIQTYLASLPVGGIYPDGEQVPVSYDEIVAALINAGVLTLGQASYVRGTPTVTLNGGVVDVPFPTFQYQAIPSASTSVTVLGV